MVYDALCRSALARRGAWLGAVLALLLGAAAFAMCHLFSGRGAFIQFGAMLGTIMVANVFFVIIPGQREMVRAKQEGREPDAQAGLRGKQRSVHNTYFTLPVLFTMISNHYAMTFGARRNWLVLIAISAAGLLIRVYFVARHKRHERGGRTSPWPVVLGLMILAAAAAALAPPSAAVARDRRLSGRAVRRDSSGSWRCAAFRATPPRRPQPGFAAAPKGLLLDTPEAIVTHAAAMGAQVQAERHAHRQPHRHDRHRTHPTPRLDSPWRTSLTPPVRPRTAASS